MEKNRKNSDNWFYKDNADPFNFNQEAVWSPYPNNVSNFIEEQYGKEEKSFKIGIGSKKYIICLQYYIQIYDDEFKDRQRYIMRSAKSNIDDFRIFRKNRLCYTFSSNQFDFLLSENESELNNLTNIKIKDLFLNKKESTYIKEGILFNTEFSISKTLVNDIKEKINSDTVNYFISSKDDLIKAIHLELDLEGNNDINQIFSLEKSNSNNYQEQAERYKAVKADDLIKYFINLYTQEGFLYNNINKALRSGSLNTNLALYLLLLQASLIIASKNSNEDLLSKNFSNDFTYNFYRWGVMPKNIIETYLQKDFSKNPTYMLFNELLSTTYNKNDSLSLVLQKLPESEKSVLFEISITKRDTITTPHLLTFIEDYSEFNGEKEVVINACSKFRIDSIYLNESIGEYKINLSFISNGPNPEKKDLNFRFPQRIPEPAPEKKDSNLGFSLKKKAEPAPFNDISSSISEKISNISINEIDLFGNLDESNLSKSIIISNKWDYIKDLNKKKLELSDNSITDEDVKLISEALNVNKHIKKVYLSSNFISVEGAKFLSETLKVNTIIKEIDLSENNIGCEGAKFIGEALKENKSLKSIYLCSNSIKDEGAGYISQALAENTKLKKLFLSKNLIGVKGAQYISEALKRNATLETIILYANQISLMGAKHISEALEVNSNLKEICLGNNSIGKDGVNFIAKALKKNNGLNIIYLNHNSIEDAGAILISNALKENKLLKRIELICNSIKDTGAESIKKALETNSVIVQIDLRNNSIGTQLKNELQSNAKISKFYFLLIRNLKIDKIEFNLNNHHSYLNNFIFYFIILNFIIIFILFFY